MAGATPIVKEPKRKRPERRRGDFCLNCEAPLNTKYCPHCGQENVHGDHSVMVLARDFLTEIAYYDSKLWLTLRTMFTHPGRLSMEWSQGKRMRYVSPIKLYLWITFIFFLAMSFRSTSLVVKTTTSPSIAGDKVTNDLSTLEGKPGWKGDLAEKIQRALGSDKKVFVPMYREQFPKVLFVLLPIFALALKLLYWRQRKYYVDSLVFVLHLHSCYFVVLLLALIVPPANTHTPAILTTTVALIGVLLACWMAAYTFVALMRFYGQPWWMTALKALILGWVYSTLLFFGLLAALLYTIYTLPMPTQPASSAVVTPK